MVKRTYLVFLLAAVVLFSGCVFSGRDKTAIEQNLAAMGAADSIEDVESIVSNQVGSAIYFAYNGEQLFSFESQYSKNNLFDFMSKAENIGVEIHDLWQQIVDSGTVAIKGRDGEAVSTWNSRMTLNVNGITYEQEFSVSVKTTWYKHNDVWLFTGIEIRIDGRTQTN